MIGAYRVWIIECGGDEAWAPLLSVLSSITSSVSGHNQSIDAVPCLAEIQKRN